MNHGEDDDGGPLPPSSSIPQSAARQATGAAA